MVTLFIVIVTILLTGFFAGIETGCYTLSKLRLFYKVTHNNKQAVVLNRIISEPQKFVFMSLILQNVFVYITSSIVTYYFVEHHIAGEKIIFIYDFFPWSAEIAATLILIFPLFIFAEVGPKNVFLNYGDTLMYRTSRLQQICFYICMPIVFVLDIISKILPGKENSKSYNFDEMNLHKLQLFFTESSYEGIITDRQNEMINNVIKLQKTDVVKVMIPINKLFSLSVNAGCSVWLDKMRKRRNNYSDIPVYSKNKKNLIGTINFFDLIHSIEKKYPTLKNKINKMININYDLNILQAFNELQIKKENKAVIIGKNNAILGVVYLKDIVAYITKKGTVK